MYMVNYTTFGTLLKGFPDIRNAKHNTYLARTFA